jgi:hypothetical protein
MIAEFVQRWEAKKEHIRALFTTKHPDDYAEVVKNVIIHLAPDPENYDPYPDPERIHEIDDGDYQGTLLFVIAAEGYQPSDYWYVRVGYGSCSGCDTLEAIKMYSDELPNEKAIDDYMTLALHIVQGLKKLDGETV